MRSNKIFNFTRLIKKYTIPFIIQLPDDDVNHVEYDDLGNKLIKCRQRKYPSKGALIPPTHNEIYQSGGRLTSSSRFMYISECDLPIGERTLPPKTLIIQKGIKYWVESREDYTDFGDFQRYVLRGVENFDRL